MDAVLTLLIQSSHYSYSPKLVLTFYLYLYSPHITYTVLTLLILIQSSHYLYSPHITYTVLTLLIQSSHYLYSPHTTYTVLTLLMFDTDAARLSRPSSYVSGHITVQIFCSVSDQTKHQIFCSDEQRSRQRAQHTRGAPCLENIYIYIYIHTHTYVYIN